MVEVIINGTSIDLISKGVKYTKQVNDLADLSTVNTSFTYSIRADKTPKNTQLFQQLGMVGDTSKFPYQKNTTQLIDNGAVLISKGITTVKETNEEYKLHIQDGIIEVFKLIENKTIGKWLDLSELDHTRNAGNIISTWQNYGAFRYLFADYGGRINSADGVIDADYLIPSASVRYLWEKVFGKIGYTHSGVPNEIDGHWITYPKEGADDDDEVVFKGLSEPYGEAGFEPWPTNDYRNWLDTGFPPIGITVLNNWVLRIDEAKNYKVEFTPTTPLNFPSPNYWGYGYMLWLTSPGNQQYFPFWIRIKLNGQYTGYEFMSDETVPREFDLGTLNVNDQVDIVIEALTDGELVQYADDHDIDLINYPGRFPQSLITYGISAWMYTQDTDRFDFQDAFSEYSIKDFFKEIMFRFSLTPFVDNHSKSIQFMTLEERLNADAIDWTDKYIRRTKETYLYNSYAQKNVLRMKYTNEEDSYADGNLYVENDNLEDERRLLESKFFAPERDLTTINFHPNGNTDNFPYVRIWDKEVREVQDNGQSVQEIQYKGLSNRFHYLAELEYFGDISLDGITSSSFQMANINQSSWAYFLDKYYSDTGKIFTDTRIHEIELALSEVDFVNIDMKKQYYFEQEMQYYILNKITWETGQPAKGEFIRVKRNG